MLRIAPGVDDHERDLVGAWSGWDVVAEPAALEGVVKVLRAEDCPAWNPSRRRRIHVADWRWRRLDASEIGIFVRVVCARLRGRPQRHSRRRIVSPSILLASLLS